MTARSVTAPSTFPFEWDRPARARLLAGIVIFGTLSDGLLAIVPGQVDNFSDGTTAGWEAGFSGGESNVSGGGPAGVGDRYMRMDSTGVNGPGGRMTVFNQSQWTGDALGAGVAVISTDLKNLGSTDLTIWLGVHGDGGLFCTSTGFALPAGTDWTRAHFAIDVSNLVSVSGNSGPDGFDAEATLEGLLHLRLLHSGSGPVWNGDPIAATIGIDNITATLAPPEPGDMNNDGAINGLDIEPFVLALVDPAAYLADTGLDPALVGDINSDGRLNGLDVEPFVELLTGGSGASPSPIEAIVRSPEQSPPGSETSRTLQAPVGRSVLDRSGTSPPPESVRIRSLASTVELEWDSAPGDVCTIEWRPGPGHRIWEPVPSGTVIARGEISSWRLDSLPAPLPRNCLLRVRTLR